MTEWQVVIKRNGKWCATSPKIFTDPKEANKAVRNMSLKLPDVEYGVAAVTYIESFTNGEGRTIDE